MIVLLKYFSPILISLFSFIAFLNKNDIGTYVLPAERHEQKSSKEDSLMSKNIIYMIMGTIVFPFISSAIFAMR